METNELFRIFNKYIVCYGPNESGTGVKGIRSDAPEEAIDAYIKWYRNGHRYESGRMLNLTSNKVLSQIIKV